jgi:uncharacterized coiled-coil DUF342 family protein
MTPNLHIEIQKVAEKVETHSKDSKQFYTEMRGGVGNIIERIHSIESEIKMMRNEGIELKIRVTNIEKEIDENRKREREYDRKFIYLTTSIIFLGFLVLILFAQ